MVSGVLLFYVQPLCAQLKVQRCVISCQHTTKSTKHTHLLYRVQFIIHSLSLSILCTLLWILLQNCIFLDSGSNRVMYLLFTAVCKIQISFWVNVNVQRSCSSALNAMLTMRGTSGNASNCRKKSDNSDRRDPPGG